MHFLRLGTERPPCFVTCGLDFHSDITLQPNLLSQSKKGRIEFLQLALDKGVAALILKVTAS